MNTPATPPRTIPVFIRSVYGQDRVYVANEQLAESIRTLTGAATLRATDISALSSLGFTFENVRDSNAPKLWGDSFGKFMQDLTADKETA